MKKRILACVVTIVMISVLCSGCASDKLSAHPLICLNTQDEIQRLVPKLSMIKKLKLCTPLLITNL